MLQITTDEKFFSFTVKTEMAFARDVADKVMFMDDGYVLEYGNPNDVFENPKQERTKQFLSRYKQQ